MCRMSIEEELARIFMQRFTLDLLNQPETKNFKLLGKLGLPARELLHVYFDVKRVFGILIPEDDVADGRFDTFANIADIICEQILIKDCSN